MTASNSASAPIVSVTGAVSSTSPGRCAIGCSSDRVVVTTMRNGGPRRSSSGWANRRSSISRAPTVSTPGDKRSCGSVSHDGNIATASPKTPRSSVVRSSASRPVAVTTSSGPACASALAANTRALAGPTRVRSLGLSAARRATSARRGIPQRQVNEPRDRGLNMGGPRCGHDVPILGKRRSACGSAQTDKRAQKCE